jgi:hypothetical protein
MPAYDAIRGEILRLADRDLDRYDFVREVVRVLRRAVPFDAMAGVWFDPETELPYQHCRDGRTDITAWRPAADARPSPQSLDPGRSRTVAVEVTARQPPRPAAEEQPVPGEAVRLPGRRLRARRPRTPLAARGDAVRSDRRLSLGRDTDATGVCTSPLHG